MAKQITVKLGADISDFQSKMVKAQKTMGRMASKLKKTGKAMTVSITAPLLAIGGAAIKGAADLEKLETSFVSLTGGTKQAADMMKQLTDFTAKTPFQIDAVANSARQLIASGTDVSQVNDQLQFLGDVAATSGSSIDEIAAIFSKVQSKGKVELESLNQLAERGIPIFSALSDATGLLPSQLGGGAVSVQQFNDVLSGFNKEGGFAEGSMERLSQTMAGKLSTAFDNLKLAGAQMVEGLLPLIHKFLEGITNLAQMFMGLDEGTKIAILTFGLLLAAIGPIITIFGTLAGAVSFLLSPIGAVIAILAVLVASFIYVLDNVEAFRERFSDISWWKNALISMLQFFVDFAADVVGGYNKMLMFFKLTPVTNPFIEMSEGLENLKDETKKYEHEFGSFGEAVSNAALKAKDALFGLGTGAGLSTGGSSPGSTNTGNQAVVLNSEMDTDDSYWEEEEENLDSYLEKYALLQEKTIAFKEATQEFGLALATDFADGFSQAIVSGENFLTSMGEIFKSLGKQIMAMIIKAAVLAALFSLIPGLGAASKGPTDFMGLLTGGLTGKASGGNVVPGQPYMVGEKGPEMFMAGQSGTIIPNQNLGQSAVPDVKISGDDLLIVFDRANRRKARR
jgi:tape measure domain-containing protein